MKCVRRHHHYAFFGLIIILFCVCILETPGQMSGHTGHNLGKVDFPVSCDNKVKDGFNHAVALLHHMTYPQARAAFRQVAAEDPKCAMAYWGVAMTLFQPLWPTRPGLEARKQGWEAVQKAKAFKPQTLREQLFVAAAEAFFFEPESSDYWQRIRRWEQSSKKVYDRFPDDSEAAVFYALSHLAIAPSNKITREYADQSAEILLKVYKKNPDHPGVMHYLVHANDVPGRERELLEITRKYETVAPDNPHAIHMPTHIYTRLGDWDGVIRGNLRAANAALKYPAGEKGEFVWDEFAHAIEYLVYGYIQKGEDEKAFEQIKRLRDATRIEPTFKTAFHTASTQARYVLERKAWNEAVLIVPREPATLNWDKFTWPEAIQHFARGYGAARLDKVDAAKSELKSLNDLEAATVKAGEDLFARNIRILRLELSSWIANAEGRRDVSVQTMLEAVELESSTPKPPVTPAPTLPASELLGDLLMEQKQPAEALAAYKRSLDAYPKRFNSLYGAARTADAAGDKSQALRFYKELLDAAKDGTRMPALEEARNYLKKLR